MSGAPCPIVVLVSGRGSNLEALIAAVQDGRIPGRLAAVISNRPGVRALELAARAGVPTGVVDHTAFPSRAAFDQALAAAIDAHHPRLVVLAGFMRILTPGFIARYAGRMLNIHPSLLPELPGLDTHARAIAAGAHRHGATVHFVTEEVDGGPPVLQASVPVLPDDSPERLAARVLAQEHVILPTAVEWFCAGRLRLRPGGPELDGTLLETPRRWDVT